ncbi:hypothetical protein CONLIGDRAFT_679603 [Coniochaeta ligniaria NRRL 30616]|uniref:Uncharacterized protein n=1 Tax=Coniochaeta ligniaria NRRL 30616 TaxID=1408157 RepID=A0A1J7JC15_9PEZI|nr:hypothetical protein CONLIGDRAFT_679603 [Coniochaeta ligniaria NRRL 30616]
MSQTLTPSFLASDPTGLMPMPVVQPQYPGLPSSDEGVRMLPLPGIRCPTCAANGQEVWVIPGRACGNCGTPCC